MSRKQIHISLTMSQHDRLDKLIKSGQEENKNSAIIKAVDHYLERHQTLRKITNMLADLKSRVG